MERISLSRKEAAEAVGVSVDTIRRAITSGELHAHKPKIGGREISKEFILVSELERWITGSPRD